MLAEFSFLGLFFFLDIEALLEEMRHGDRWGSPPEQKDLTKKSPMC